MTHKHLARVFAFTVLLGSCKGSVPASSPGDAVASAPRLEPARFDSGVVRAATDTFLVTSRGGAVVDTIAWAVQTYRRVDANNSAVWEQVFVWRGADGTIAIDSLLFDATTLRPITQRLSTPSGRKVVHYREGRVRVEELRTGQAPDVTEASFEVPVYSAAEIDVVTRALPLPIDGTVQLALFYAGGPGFQWATIRAAGEERIRTRGGRDADCWRVDVSAMGDTQRYWIAKDGRDVLKIVDGDVTSGSQILR